MLFQITILVFYNDIFKKKENIFLGIFKIKIYIFKINNFVINYYSIHFCLYMLMHILYTNLILSFHFKNYFWQFIEKLQEETLIH